MGHHDVITHGATTYVHLHYICTTGVLCGRASSHTAANTLRAWAVVRQGTQCRYTVEPPLGLPRMSGFRDVLNHFGIKAAYVIAAYALQQLVTAAARGLQHSRRGARASVPQQRTEPQGRLRASIGDGSEPVLHALMEPLEPSRGASVPLLALTAGMSCMHHHAA
jgi:hypothetical protein